jgi:hypothetical protein
VNDAVAPLVSGAAGARFAHGEAPDSPRTCVESNASFYTCRTLRRSSLAPGSRQIGLARMSKAILMSVLVVPVVAGLLAGKQWGLRGVSQARLAFYVFGVIYMVFVYYQYFRWR